LTQPENLVEDQFVVSLFDQGPPLQAVEEHECVADLRRDLLSPQGHPGQIDPPLVGVHLREAWPIRQRVYEPAGVFRDRQGGIQQRGFVDVHPAAPDDIGQRLANLEIGQLDDLIGTRPFDGLGRFWLWWWGRGAELNRRGRLTPTRPSVGRLSLAFSRRLG